MCTAVVLAVCMWLWQCVCVAELCVAVAVGPWGCDCVCVAQYMWTMYTIKL
jgi:hypothetical protein